MEVLRAFCAAQGFPLADDQVAAFEDFRRRLYAWNAHTNLTRVPEGECEVRHFVDSLLIAEFVPPGARVLDIGTGAGFPAWPLARARPDVEVVALDSGGKALAFLATAPLPNLMPRHARAESLGEREAYDVVTGRAIAPLAAQLELSAAWCRIGGAVVPFRTPAEESAVRTFPAAELGLELEEAHRRTLPGTDVERLLPVFRKVAATPRRYPRPWKSIRAQPLGGSVG